MQKESNNRYYSKQISSQSTGNEFINEFLANNLSNLVQNSKNLDVRDLCMLFTKIHSRQNVEYYGLLESLTNHPTLAVEEIVSSQPANILEYKSSLFVVRLVIFLLYIRSYNKKCFLGFLQINIMFGVIIKRVQKESH